MSKKYFGNNEGVSSEISIDQVFVHVTPEQNTSSICAHGLRRDHAIGADRIWFVPFDHAQAALSHVYDQNGVRPDYYAVLFVLPGDAKIKELVTDCMDYPYYYIEQDLDPQSLCLVDLGQYVLPNIDGREILFNWMINLTHVGFARAFGEMDPAAIEIFGALHTRLLVEHTDSLRYPARQATDADFAAHDARGKVAAKDWGLHKGSLGEDLEHHDYMVGLENDQDPDPNHYENCSICKYVNDKFKMSHDHQLDALDDVIDELNIRALDVGLYEPENIVRDPTQGMCVMVPVQAGDHVLAFDVNGKLIQLQQHVRWLAEHELKATGLVVGFEDGKPVVDWPGLGRATELQPGVMLEVIDG